MHLAQLNIGRFRAPTDDPLLADIMAGLDHINALAEATSGFVGRLQDESGNATDIPWSSAPLMAVNMSVWESVEALRGFTYRSEHTEFLKRRREWFERMDFFMVLWWVPVGHIPTLQEARERLEQLDQHGPTPYAFTFAKVFAPDQG